MVSTWLNSLLPVITPSLKWQWVTVGTSWRFAKYKETDRVCLRKGVDTLCSSLRKQLYAPTVASLLDRHPYSSHIVKEIRVVSWREKLP